MSIEDKIRQYMESPAGQKKLQEKIKEYQRAGVRTTKAGSKLVTKEVALELANALKDMIVGSLPGQISGTINGMTCEGPYLEDGGNTYKVSLSFAGDLSRPSLGSTHWKSGEKVSAGGGITNIVALFNNGYIARDYVYGYWAKHDAVVRSRRQLEPMQFMQSAVRQFNATYGKQYDINVTLSGIYEDEPLLAGEFENFATG